MGEHAGTGHFKNDKTTRGALLQFSIFVLVVLGLMWAMGWFKSW